MFLKPAQVNKGERVLCIIDFVGKLVPNSDDHTISEVGSTRLLVSFGSKKPKLESVSLAQWVIGNTQIFHTLLQLGRLPSQADVHYLAYTVKIMELSTRFSWASVLKYDELAEDVESALRFTVQMKGDVFINLPPGLGKSVVFQALPVVYSCMEPSCERNIVIVISPLINLMKDQVSRLTSLGISAISLSNISFESEVIPSFTGRQSLGWVRDDGGKW